MGNQQIREAMEPIQSTSFQVEELEPYIAKVWTASNVKELENFRGMLKDSESLDKNHIAQGALDSKSSSIDSKEDRFHQQALQLISAGFISAEKQKETLKQGHYKQIVIVSSKEAEKQEKLMRLKAEILTAMFFSRNQGGSEVSDDFYTFARKMMMKQCDTYHYAATIQSTLMCSPDAIEDQLAKNPAILKTTLQNMLSLANDLQPEEHFNTNMESFKEDLANQKLRQVLLQAVESEQADTEIRELAVKLLLRIGLVRASGEDLLRAALLQSKYKINITNELKYFCTQSEVFKDPLAVGSGEGFDLHSHITCQSRVSFDRGSDRADGKDQLTHCGNSWFIWSADRGMTRGSKKLKEGTWECQKQDEDTSYKNLTMFSHQGDWLVRSSNYPDKPFVIFSQENLKEDKDETPYKMHPDSERSLCWTPEDTDFKEDVSKGNRWYREAPLFSDGELIYTMVRYRESGISSKVVRTVVEIYECEDKELKFLNEVPLFKNAEKEPFIGSKSKDCYLLQGSIACNGAVFIWHSSNKFHIFEMSKGIRVIKEHLNSTDLISYYDNTENWYYHMDACCYSWLKRWQIQNFKPRVLTKKVRDLPPPPIVFDSVKGELLEKIKAFKEAQEAQTDTDKPMSNMFMQLSFNEEPVPCNLGEQVVNDGEVDEGCHDKALAIILSKMGIEAQTALFRVKSLGSKQLVAEDMFPYFKRSYSVYCSRNYLILIRESLSQALEKMNKDKESIFNQANTLNLLYLYLANLQSLVACRIQFKLIFPEEEMIALKNLESQLEQVKLFAGQESKANEDLTPTENMQMHLNHQSELLVQIIEVNLDADTISTKLNFIEKALSKDDDTLAIQLGRYLSTLTTKRGMQVLFEGSKDELDHSRQTIKLCVKFMKELVLKDLDRAIKNKGSKNVTAHSGKTRQIISFVNSYCEELLFNFGITLLTINEKQDIKREGELDNDEKLLLDTLLKAEARKKLLEEVVYEIFIIVSESFRELMVEISKKLRAGKIHEWKKVEHQLALFEFMKEIIVKPVSSFKICMMFSVSCFAHEAEIVWLDEIAEALRNCAEGLDSYLIMKKNLLFEERIKLDEHDSFHSMIETAQRGICHSMSAVAYRLIQAKSSTHEDIQSLSKLTILQGGVESRFIPSLSAETKEQIEGSFKIIKDQKLQQLALQDSDAVALEDDDTLLAAIIDENNSQPKIENTLSLLQNRLEGKTPTVPFANVGGQSGQELTRSAFAVILKFTDGLRAFNKLVKDVEEQQIGQKSMINESQVSASEMNSPEFTQMLNQYEKASQMRSWTSQIKSKIDSEVRAEVDKTIRQQINDANASAEPFTGPFDEEHQKQFDEKHKQLFDEKVESAYKSAIEKSKFLVQLATPQAFIDQKVKATLASFQNAFASKVSVSGIMNLVKIKVQQIAGTSKINPILSAQGVQRTDQLRTTDGVASGFTIKTQDTSAKKSILVKSGQIDESDKEVDWRDRLRDWKKMGQSAGSVTSFTDDNANAMKSTAFSVLALLQAPCSSEQLKGHIESSLISGLRRSAGLHLLNFAMNLSFQENRFIDLVQWFQGSMRDNIVQVCHYMTNVDSCGNNAQASIRKNFAQILERILDVIKHEQLANEDNYVHLLDALCWDYKPEDLHFLDKHDIFNTLLKGNGEIVHPLRVSWGRESNYYKLDNEVQTNFNLATRLRQVFNFITNSVLEKIFVDQSSENASGQEQDPNSTSEPKVDQAVANRMLANIAQFLFGSIERYLSMTKEDEIEQSEDSSKMFTAGAESEEPDSNHEYPQDIAGFINANGGPLKVKVDRKINKYLDSLKVAMIINKIKSDAQSISLDSSLASMLKTVTSSSADGEISVDDAVKIVKQRRFRAVTQITQMSWEELGLEKPSLSPENEAHISGETLEDIKKLRGISDDSEDEDAQKKQSESQISLKQMKDQINVETKEIQDKIADNCKKLHLAKDQKSKADLMLEDARLKVAYKKAQKAASDISSLPEEKNSISGFAYSEISFSMIINQLNQLLLLSSSDTSFKEIIILFSQPENLQLLFQLTLSGSIRTRIMVYKIIQQLMKLDKPQSTFDDAVNYAAEQNNGKNRVAKLLNSTTAVDFKQKSSFLQLLFNSTQDARRCVYSKRVKSIKGIEAILQEQLRTSRVLYINVEQNSSLRAIFTESFGECLDNILSYDRVAEIDAIFSFIPATALRSLTIGSPLVNYDGKIQIALGLSTESSSSKAHDRDIYAMLSDDNAQYVQVLSHDPMRPEIQDQLLVPLYEPSVLLDSDLNQSHTAARASLLLKPAVLKSMVEILSQDSEEDDTDAQKLRLQTLQIFCIRGLYRLLDILKEEFLQTLDQMQLTDQVIKILMTSVHSNDELSQLDLLSSNVHETRLSMLRQTIMGSNEFGLQEVSTINNRVVYSAQILEDSKTVQLIAKVGRSAKPDEIFFFTIVNKFGVQIKSDINHKVFRSTRKYSNVKIGIQSAQQLMNLENESVTVEMLVHAKCIITETSVDFEQFFKKLGDLASSDPAKYEEVLNTQFITVSQEDFQLMDEMYDSSIASISSYDMKNIGYNFFTIMTQLDLYPESTISEGDEVVKECQILQKITKAICIERNDQSYSAVLEKVKQLIEKETASIDDSYKQKAIRSFFENKYRAMARQQNQSPTKFSRNSGHIRRQSTHSAKETKVTQETQQNLASWKDFIHTTQEIGVNHGDTWNSGDEDINALKDNFADDKLPRISCIELFADDSVCYGFQLHYHGDYSSTQRKGKAFSDSAKSYRHELAKDEYITSVSGRFGCICDQIIFTTSEGREFTAGSTIGKEQISEPKSDYSRPYLLACSVGMGAHMHSIYTYFVDLSDVPHLFQQGGEIDKKAVNATTQAIINCSISKTNFAEILHLNVEITEKVEQQFWLTDSEKSDDVLEVQEKAIKQYRQVSRNTIDDELTTQYVKTMSLLKKSTCRDMLFIMLAEANNTFSRESVKHVQSSQSFQLISDMIHIQYTMSQEVKDQFLRKYQAKQVEAQTQPILQFMKQKDKFCTFFVNDLLTKAKNFLIWAAEQETMLTMRKVVDEEINQLFLDPRNLIYFGRMIFEQGYVAQPDVLRVANALFDILIGYALIYRSPEDFDLTHLLLQAVLDHLTVIELNLGGMSGDAQIMEEFFGSKALKILAQNFDTSRGSYSKRQKLVLELITRVVTLQKKLNTDHKKEVPYSFEFHDSFDSTYKNLSVLRQGRSFASFMGKLKFKALLASSIDSQQIKHIAKTYSTISQHYNTPFIKEITATEQDLVINLDKNTSEYIVSITGDDGKPLYGDQKAFKAGRKITYTVKKGKTATLAYPSYPLVLKYSGSLQQGYGEGIESTDVMTNMDASADAGAIAVYAKHHAFCLIGSDGSMWGAGFRAQGTNSDSGRLQKIETPPECKDIRKVVHGKFFRVVLTEDRKIWFTGQNRKYMFSQYVGRNDHTEHLWEPSENFFRLDEDDRISDVTAGKHYTAVATDKGKIYASSYIFYRHFTGCRYNQEENEDYPFLLKLPDESLMAVKLFGCEKHNNLWATAKAVNGKMQTFGAGQNKDLIGHNQSSNEEHFYPIAVPEDTWFQQIESQRGLAFGIDQDENLWQWGEHFGQEDADRLTLYDRASMEYGSTPAPLHWFKEKQMKCLEVKCGGSFALVKTRDKNDKIEMYVISNGDEHDNEDSDRYQKFGGKSELEPMFKSFIYRLKVDASIVVSFACTIDASFLLFTGKKQIVSNDPENQEAVGLTHFYQEDHPDKVLDQAGTKAKVWKFLTQEEYEEKKDSLPDVCFASRHRIEGLAEALSNIHEDQASDKDWTYSGLPDLAQVLVDKESPQKLKYHAKSIVVDGEEQPWISEAEALSFGQEFDLEPKIYIRTKYSLMPNIILPEIDISNLFVRAENESAQIAFTIKNKEIDWGEIETYKLTDPDKVELFEKAMNFSEDQDEQILQLIDKQMSEKHSDREIRDLAIRNFDLSKELFLKESSLLEIDERAIQMRAELLFKFNKAFTGLSSCVNVSGKNIAGSMAQQHFASRGMSLHSSLQRMLALRLDRVSEGDRYHITVNYTKADQFTKAGNVDREGTISVFGQIIQQLLNASNENLNCFRKKDKSDQPFNLEIMQAGNGLKCGHGHFMFMRYTAQESRGGSGQNVRCDLCREGKNLDDITSEGIFKCKNYDCDHDVCRSCGLKNGGIFVPKSSKTEDKDEDEDEQEGQDDCDKYLYRICREMEKGAVPLLIKSPNNRNDHGSDRDCFVLDPSSTSPASLRMFKYLGAFIAFSLASQRTLPLNLAPTVWKQIFGLTLTLDDLALIDAYSSQVLSDLREFSHTLSDQEFEATVDQNFVTVLSNGDEVVLCEGGEEKKVNKANFEEFISLVIKARTSEAAEQSGAIQEGIRHVLASAVGVLGYLTPRDLEIRICGERKIEVEAFKSITVYPNCKDDHEIVERFWRVFEEFTDEQRALYLLFVWGRRRLPKTLKNVRKHELRLMADMSETSFPQARTCFFQIDIPFYQTDEQCRERLITAVKQCNTVDISNENFAEV